MEARLGSNRLKNVGEVVSLTHRQAALYPQKDFWYSFLLEDESTPRATVRLEGLSQLKKKKKTDDLIGNRTRDLPGCSILLLLLFRL
jgi:hypothetical protein